MKARKILVSIAALALVAAISIGGTLAYLTSKDTVTNTFTVGNVSITLDEAKVNEDGKAVNKSGNVVDNLAAADRVKANDYHLIPGHTYVKDPTVTVLAGSENSYVRMLVTVTFGKTLTDGQLATNLDSIFTGYDGAAWVRADKQAKTVGEGDAAHTVITYEYRYNTTVSAGAGNNVLPALFTGITVPGDWNGDTLAAIGGFTIGIEAQAIQADGFDNADAAWAKF